MSRTFPLALLAITACAPALDEGTADVAGLHADQAAPPISLSQPGYLLRGIGITVAIEGGTTGHNAFLAGGTNLVGPGVCPAALAPNCLGLANPFRVLAQGTINAQGRFSANLTVPNNFAGDAVEIEGVTRGGGTSFVTGSVVVPVLDGAGDEDGDGFTNAQEHNVGTDLFNADNDGDGFDVAGGDCNDQDDTISPGATELANGIDDDCDGIVDEGTAGFDDDGDGFTEDQGDCDDDDVAVNPQAVEVANGLDDNCDGQIDEGLGGGGTLMITEVVDHLTNFNCRFIELYNPTSEPVLLDGWSIDRYSNGGTTGSVLSLTVGATVPPGGFWVMAASQTNFEACYFLVFASQYNSGINGNGDDAYTLANNGTIVDAFGVIGERPLFGVPWNYQDATVTRNLNVVAPNATFDLNEWTFTPGDATSAPFVR